MTRSLLSKSFLPHFFQDIHTLQYIITHVFFPLRPPHDYRAEDDDEVLAEAIAGAARLYGGYVDQAHLSHWNTISRMLENLQTTVGSRGLDVPRIIAQLNNMNVGDVVALHIQEQSEGVIFRKQEEVTIYEAFELSPNAQDVLATEGKLICSYPRSAIEIPDSVLRDENFRSELANFLVHMSYDSFRAYRVGPEDQLSKEVIFDSRNITGLLTSILRSVGRPIDISRISKRVGDDITCHCGLEFPLPGQSTPFRRLLRLRQPPRLQQLPLRRSALWLLIRVALQTTLVRSPLALHTYKEFMLFFMCSLATEKSCSNFPSDLLQFMSTKISRRLRKLGSSAPDWLLPIVLQTCTSLRSIIEDRWQQVQATQRLSPPWMPSQLDLTRDTRLTLSNSRRHIAKSLADGRVRLADKKFRPKHRRRGNLDDFLSTDGQFFDDAYRIEPHVTLYDVERAVELNIDAWVARVTSNDEACVKLEILADKYSSRALETYTNNPELLSVMLLTTIELWVALDKIATKEIPMLADYSPEIPITLLEYLLLSKSASLCRLRNVHEYLHRRHVESRNQCSVFSSVVTVDSFAVRYYHASSYLQRFKTRVEKATWYDTRIEAVKAWIGDVWYRRNSDEFVDWNPDPAFPLRAEVVFELHCPVSFDMWRTATFHLLINLCSPPVEELARPYFPLISSYTLGPHLVKHPRSRVSLGSNEERVLVLYDTRTNLPLSEVSARVDSKIRCTYNLQGPYINLQKYIGYPSYTSNEVIANQADWHEDLSTYEYMAFSHLRSGGLLQWPNILRELRARVLSFRCPEVHMLFSQAIYQVGPLKGAEWLWHQEIKQPAFCYTLLCELESLLRDVGGNWTEGMTMDTISNLLRRLLASSLDGSISQKTINLLRIVRVKVFSWVLELLNKVGNTSEDKWLCGVLRDTAAICRGTYDVDPDMIPSPFQSADDVEVFLYTAMIIQRHLDVPHPHEHSKLLLQRNFHLSLTLESAVNRIIQSRPCQEGITRAVRRIWPGKQASEWRPLLAPNSRWISCTTVPPDGQRPQVVHFNLLDGSLLVDGRPLGHCLPDEFMQHSLYEQIFGKQRLQVTHSNIPGTKYSTNDLIFDHLVYFSLRNKGTDLIIRAKRKSAATDSTETMELIPHNKLRGDLPSSLVEGHVHWLDLSTSIMEIRPLDSLWETSSENWRIDCTPGQYRMWKGDTRERLIDVRSPSWTMVSSIFLPLDAPGNLIITTSPMDPSQPASPLCLCVVLPRYDLSFYVDMDGDLQCRNIRGMVYDENQFLGTLFGLANKIVLRPKIRSVGALRLAPRCVIIPEGRVSYHMAHHHAQVKVLPEDSVLDRATYQTYTINTDLGCLVGNGSLASKLYCAYLHALTSGSSIDPLTGRSGAEEALTLLQSAGCCSDMRFGPREAELLILIASICPVHRQDPDQNYQRVQWGPLPVNSPSYALYLVSKSIKERYERLVRLSHESPSNVSFEKFPDQVDHYLKRSARRAAHLYPSEFSVHLFPANADAQYSRDLAGPGSEELRAYTAATCVYYRTATSNKDVWEIMQSWWENRKFVFSRSNSLRTRSLALGRRNPSGVILRYDSSWLAPDFPWIWVEVYNALRTSDERTWFQMLFSLPSMAYTSPQLSNLVPIFVAFASCQQFRSEDPPSKYWYPVDMECTPSLDALRKYVLDSAYPFKPERLVRRKDGKRLSDSHPLEIYNKRRNADADITAQELLRAWPCDTPPPCSLLNPRLYDIADLQSNIQYYFSACFLHLKFKEHLTRVQTILNDLHCQGSSGRADTILYSFHPSQDGPRVPRHFTTDHIFTRSAPQLPAADILLLPHATRVENTSIPDPAPLNQLISTVKSSAVNRFQDQYVSSLHGSAESFRSEMILATRAMEPPSTESLIEHYAICRASYIIALDLIQRQLRPITQSERAMKQSGQWPRFTPHALFRYLASSSPITLSDDWRRCLTRFALLALARQRARRLLLLHFDGLHEELCRELENTGCHDWDEAYPDWLLIQLQGNFLIRRVQAEVANELISPCSNSNTAMQLNMGEGKSSVIVPIAAAVLANGDQLVRVVVPKPLIAEAFQIMADRLGGLTNRRIYHLPFSRSLELDDHKVTSLHETLLECMRERGILVVQPDHILSLKLASVEKQLSREKDDEVAHKWLQLQKWLHIHSRDILDEIDEILDVRSELVFAIGHQQHVEGSPERWTTIGQVLGLVDDHASFLQEEFTPGIEYKPGPPGTFPYLRILQKDAGEKLISLLVQDIMDGRLPNTSMRNLRFSPRLEDAIRSFISCETVSSEDAQLVKEYSKKESGSLWGGLLLLRGLMATGVLLFAFGEWRWRVNYGLATTRTMLAVPYRAKDVPAPRAEFGHPDTAIILTYLSYYYGGLSEEQLKHSFGIMLKQHDPSLIYGLWVRTCTVNLVPEPLRKLGGVNMKSERQWNDFLYPLFSRNRATIDFYLSNVVFPREAKEFPSKLSSSGWDLTEQRQRLVTGFSGTNDGHHLLPVNISQRHPEHQRGTNAKVLSYVLQPENSHYVCINHEDGRRRTTREFLEILVVQKIRVLLDVGAQMLDLQNHELAKMWLDITPLADASAVIYFNVDDELMTCARDGTTQQLRESPFAQQIDRCLAYLDDAHTRGTSIEFPSGFHAAVTLGPRVTKERLVQGCMRMRKLGHGHSITFFAPIEVDQRIRAVTGKKLSDDIDNADILHWAIRETWDNTQRWAPRWAQQGTDHISRHAAWSSYCDDKLSPESLSTEWLRPEAKSLEYLYEPRAPSGSLSVINEIHPDMRQRCIDLGFPLSPSAGLDEEQERELQREERRERVRPPRVPPATHSVHPDVVEFVKTGILPVRTDPAEMETAAFVPAWNMLGATSAVTNEAQIWSQSMWVTSDFEKTVEEAENMDDYLRPVQWIISAKGDDGDVFVIISPYEANYLLADVRSSSKVHLHLYTPCVTRSMKSCNDLSLYSIPPIPNDSWTLPPSSLMDRLNMFAGQLYLKDYEAYIRLCNFLGVYARDLEHIQGIITESDGFILPKNRKPLKGVRIELTPTFETTPLTSLKALTDLRCKDVDYILTDMGKVLHGRPLSRDDFND